MIAQTFKDGLLKIGKFFPRNLIQILDSMLHYIEGGKWMSEHKFRMPKRIATKDKIFEYLGGNCSQGAPLYLEFGVFRGETIAQMAALIKNKNANLHGFDSFIGLPERWNRFNKKGHFSTGGHPPQINDSRVKFFAGWFDEVLKEYTPPPHDFLIINIDCDLYSSTICVLNALTNRIQIGTHIFFDEFYDRNNERKAFEEFLEQTGFQFECLMATKGLAHALFVRKA